MTPPFDHQYFLSPLTPLPPNQLPPMDPPVSTASYIPLTHFSRQFWQGCGEPVWYETTGLSQVHGPPVSIIPNNNDLFIHHHSSSNLLMQMWIWMQSSWLRIAESDAHPNNRSCRLFIPMDGKPSWPTAHSVATICAAKRAKLCLAGNGPSW